MEFNLSLGVEFWNLCLAVLQSLKFTILYPFKCFDIIDDDDDDDHVDYSYYKAEGWSSSFEAVAFISVRLNEQNVRWLIDQSDYAL